MNTVEFLTSLRKADISITVKGEGLQINAPSGAMTESLKIELKNRKKEIVDFLSKATKPAEKEGKEIFRVSRDSDIPVSPSQERMWSLSQLIHEDPSYNMHIAFSIKGSLNIPALEKSLRRIIERHEILRTTFSIANGKPVQIISPEPRFTLTKIDLKNFDEETQASEIERLVKLEARTPFDLMHGPFMRTTLLEANSYWHVFMVTMHHIISDGWSFSVFFHELATLYETIISDQEKLLPELSIQYADFSGWQRRWLEGEKCRVHLEYWRKELGNNLDPLILPLDHPRPNKPTTEASSQTLKVPSAIVREIGVLGKRHGISHNIIFLTAFLVVLFKYCDQEDLVICSPVSGRNRDEVQPLIGFFNNIVPIRIFLNKDLSIYELLENVRIKTLDGLEHQEIPLHHIISESYIDQVPMTRAMFNFQSKESQTLTLPGTTIEAFEIHNGTTNFELSLTVVEEGENYTCSIEYKAALFNNTTIRDMLAYFESVLEIIGHDPAQKLTAIPPMSDERQKETYRKFEESDRNRGTDYVAPRTKKEQIIASIWQAVFKVEKIGIHDNFFAIGGHSLLATKLLARLQSTLDMEVSFRTFFEAPSVAALAQQLEDVNTIGWHGASDTLVPIPRAGPLPLSFAQQRLWFLDQWEPGSTAYLLPFAWRLKGLLHVAALETSLTDLVARHESLRTTISRPDGHPVQIIAPNVPFHLPLHDLTSFPELRREAELKRLIDKETHQPFNLATGPLWRGKLFRLATEEHVLLLTFHHIITDDWSMGVFLNEWTMLYKMQVTAQHKELPPLPLQYADYAIWQRHQLQGEELNQHQTYWCTQLAKAPHGLDLPTDFLRPPQLTYCGERLTFTLSTQLTQKLQTLCRREGVTLFMTMLAGFQLLLCRYTGQRDILLGTPIAGRTHTHLEGLIGFFVNTLVLRTPVTGHPSFQEFLQQVRETCLEAYEHQDMPFEKLVEALQPTRDPSRHPLFQVMFQLDQEEVNNGLPLPNIQTEAIQVSTATTTFDLLLSLALTEENIRGSFTFNTDLFTSDTIKQLATHYQQLLEGLVENPQQGVRQIPLLTNTEQQRLIIEWNGTTQDYPQNTCIHQLFEAQVERTPEAIAIVFKDQQLTYQELNRRANQLAHFLREQGVGPDIRVGLCIGRGLEMITSLLGVLKAGGAYVPLDSSYPEERQQYIVTHSQPKCILTQPGFCLWLKHTETSRIDLDSDWSCCEQYPPYNPISFNSPLNLAYIIYTSGSTGKPKGVMVTHQSVSNLLFTLQQHTGIDKTTTLLAVTNLSFDISMLELLGPLIVGGRVVLIGREVATDGVALRAVVQFEAITMMQATPSTWSMLIQSNPTPLPRPINILCGGEPLTPDLAHQLESWGATIWNVYGPTETTIWSTIWKCESPNEPISIGHPLANTTAFLVDQILELVPVGVTGQILIGGDGVARGYHGNPILTAENFIPHPYSPEHGARLYRSGDIAKHRADGSLEFLGRRDNQVKLRGFRIECGEIETTLTTHPTVREAIVLCREDRPGNKTLVAYVVLTDSHQLTTNDMSFWLKRTLPDYMVPSIFVTLKAFPLTPNGKADRQSLPAPNQTHWSADTTYVGPRNSFEAQLMKIWEAVIGKTAYWYH